MPWRLIPSLRDVYSNAIACHNVCRAFLQLIRFLFLQKKFLSGFYLKWIAIKRTDTPVINNQSHSISSYFIFIYSKKLSNNLKWLKPHIKRLIFQLFFRSCFIPSIRYAWVEGWPREKGMKEREKKRNLL